MDLGIRNAIAGAAADAQFTPNERQVDCVAWALGRTVGLVRGPPGTGKTLIARKISEALNCEKPKIVNGPEIFDKFVGKSEEKIRELFVDAEEEYREKGDESGLHVIIFDEIDAICRKRGAGGGSSTGVNESVVN